MTKKKDNLIRRENSFSMEKVIFILAAILLVTYISFSPTLKNGFINWDDNAYVFDNMYIARPVPDAMQFFFGPNYFVGNYIPLTMIAYVLEYHAAGMKPHFFHLVNVLIHLMNVVLVFWFTWLLSGKKWRVAALVALFFGVHPMHVESVAWIAELKDVLYTLFFMAGLIVYYKYLQVKTGTDLTRKKPWRFLAMAFIFFLLSVLSKPAAVAFPLVLLVLDFYAHRKFDKVAWLEKLPFFCVSVIFGIVAIKAQQADKLLHADYSFLIKLLFAAHSFLNYILGVVFPFNLSIFYPYPILKDASLPSVYYFAPFLLLLFFYGVYRSLRSSRLIAFGLLFFFTNIILVLQFVSVGDAIRADRYTYISYIGLFFIAAMGIEQLYQSKKERAITVRPFLSGLILLLALGCSYLTYARCKVWKDDDSIATDLLAKFPEDRLALNNKGFILFEQGKNEEAITLFRKAIRLKPDYILAYINLTNAYLALNNYSMALNSADSALKAVPGDYNLLTKKGNVLYVLKKYTDAMEVYNKAIAVEKKKSSAYIYLAECYYAINDYDGGIKTIEAGLTYKPDNYILLNNKGYFLFLKKEYVEAAEYFKASLRIKPDYTTASVNLQDCYRNMPEASPAMK